MLPNIYELVDGDVFCDADVGAVAPVLGANLLAHLKRHLALVDRGGQVDPALVLAGELDLGRHLVAPDSEPLELVLDQVLVRHRFHHVEA